MADGYELGLDIDTMEVDLRSVLDGGEDARKSQRGKSHGGLMA